MSRTEITHHICAALEQLAIAQSIAKRAAADSFCHDIPDGRSHRYAVAYAFSEHITITRDIVRNLLDQAAGSRTVQSAARPIPAHAAERPAAMDAVSSAGSELVHTRSSIAPGSHD